MLALSGVRINKYFFDCFVTKPNRKCMKNFKVIV